MTETCEKNQWGVFKGAKSFDLAVHESHLHTRESLLGTILRSVFLSCVVPRTGDGSGMGQHGAHIKRSLCKAAG